MERETTTLETPIEKHSVVLISYLIGREKRALQTLFLEKGVSATESGISGVSLDADLVNRRENLAWNTCVLSVDGHKEGDVIEGQDKPFSIVEAILNMRAEDYGAIVKKVNELTTEKKTA